MTTVNSAFTGNVTNLEIKGVPKFFTGAGTTIPGGSVTLLTLNVGATEKYNLAQFLGSCSMTGKFVVKLDGVVIAVRRTQPGKPDVTYEWKPRRPVLGVAVIIITFEANSGKPAASVDYDLQTGFIA